MVNQVGNTKFPGFEPGQMLIGQRTISFELDNPQDHVQRRLWRGRFYENDLLADHARVIFKGSTVIDVDVGANVGNHTVYDALRTRAQRVYPFEPNPRAAHLVRRTVERNEITQVDLQHLHLGVDDKPGTLFVHSPGENNLGRTMLRRRGREGLQAVSVAPLDDLSFEGPISLLKIDVEGMEMRVLAGAARLMAEHRPHLAVEVDRRNQPAFWAWADDNRYHVISAQADYPSNINYVCVPRS